MKYIKTITGDIGFSEDDSLYLISPSINKPNIPNNRCIIDCHTFYLKRYTKGNEKRLSHYTWFMAFIQNVPSHHIILLPDFHNVVKEETLLTDLWNEYLKDSKHKILSHPNNPLSKDLPNNRIIGHYLYFWDKEDNYIVHDKWTHILSQYETNIEPKSELVTYDSVYNRHNCNICKIKDLDL